MLPLVLVYLFAQSAFALPAVPVTFYQITDDQGTVPDNGDLINKNVSLGALEYIDGGETPLYMQELFDIVSDVANCGEPNGQAIAALQIIAIIGELASGIPGDACESTALINAALNNPGKLKFALARYIKYFIGYIDVIVDLVLNPVKVRCAVGPHSKCIGGGRFYPFEEIWAAIQARSQSALETEYLNYEYCAAKRLFTCFNVRNNNVAAAITATVLTPVANVGQIALVPITRFLRVVARGGNPAIAAEFAKAALLKAVGKVRY